MSSESPTTLTTISTPSHGTSTENINEDWTNVSDRGERSRMQRRNAFRNYRAKMPIPRRRIVTEWDRREIRLYHKQNPGAGRVKIGGDYSQTIHYCVATNRIDLYIAAVFGWGPTTVSRILSQKERYLPNTQEGPGIREESHGPISTESLPVPVSQSVPKRLPTSQVPQVQQYHATHKDLWPKGFAAPSKSPPFQCPYCGTTFTQELKHHTKPVTYLPPTTEQITSTPAAAQPSKSPWVVEGPPISENMYMPMTIGAHESSSIGPPEATFYLIPDENIQNEGLGAHQAFQRFLGPQSVFEEDSAWSTLAHCGRSVRFVAYVSVNANWS
ncbi:hypothetical protein AJ80_08828 [Polytolypa hystricis UAMH7299]|uniref:Uncharacterized protein n=1 Tax=Polytolypa hystricis (strain UAMH7299) TaxID=1447883 RepID=A0A2B7X0N4_POLH7|nr:hypothetical protein AJ80_08828 [Polytolypa hystricis UAMH7299]